jgi:hypothetical protein
MKLRTRGRFNLKRWSRVAGDRLRGTPFDRALRAARLDGRHRFVFGWNRGLGDIALGLVPLFARIRAVDSASRIEVFTRQDLAEPFALTDADAIHVVPALVRGAAVDLQRAAQSVGVSLPPSAVLFADPDPTRWLDGRRREYPPALRWDPGWNSLADALLPASPDEIVIGAHVDSETAQYYGYVKDWPADAWKALFARFPASRGVRWVLFGNAKGQDFPQDNVADFRARTSFLALLATIRTRCRILVAPDSGVLTAAYYLADDFPLDVISLWSDPRQGILKQDCPSPNPRLRHVVLRGRDEDVRNLTVDDVARAVAAALDPLARLPSAANHASAH